MNIDNKPDKMNIGDKIVHDLRASLILPSIKIEVDRALIDYNDQISEKVSAMLDDTITNFDLDLYIDKVTKDTVEYKFKQAIEYAINKKVAEMTSEISQAAYDIVSKRLGDE